MNLLFRQCNNYRRLDGLLRGFDNYLDGSVSLFYN